MPGERSPRSITSDALIVEMPSFFTAVRSGGAANLAVAAEPTPVPRHRCCTDPWRVRGAAAATDGNWVRLAPALVQPFAKTRSWHWTSVGIERRWSAMSLVLALLGAARAALRTHTNLALENLALRQQLALLRHRSKRPRFGRLDRAFWVWLSRRWAGWRKALYVVRPETVIRWHRQGFRGFWTWKSRRGERVDRLSARSLRTSSAPWRTPILSGVPRAFMASCSSSASRFRSGPLRVSCRAARSHPRRPGERSSRTTS